jgi:hypothetical protein
MSQNTGITKNILSDHYGSSQYNIKRNTINNSNEKINEKKTERGENFNKVKDNVENLNVKLNMDSSGQSFKNRFTNPILITSFESSNSLKSNKKERIQSGSILNSNFIKYSDSNIESADKINYLDNVKIINKNLLIHNNRSVNDNEKYNEPKNETIYDNESNNNVTKDSIYHTNSFNVKYNKKYNIKQINPQPEKISHFPKFGLNRASSMNLGKGKSLNHNFIISPNINFNNSSIDRDDFKDMVLYNKINNKLIINTVKNESNSNHSSFSINHSNIIMNQNISGRRNKNEFNQSRKKMTAKHNLKEPTLVSTGIKNSCEKKSNSAVDNYNLSANFQLSTKVNVCSHEINNPNFSQDRLFDSVSNILKKNNLPFSNSSPKSVSNDFYYLNLKKEIDLNENNNLKSKYNKTDHFSDLKKDLLNNSKDRSMNKDNFLYNKTSDINKLEGKHFNKGDEVTYTKEAEICFELIDDKLEEKDYKNYTPLKIIKNMQKNSLFNEENINLIENQQKKINQDHNTQKLILKGNLSSIKTINRDFTNKTNIPYVSSTVEPVNQSNILINEEVANFRVNKTIFDARNVPNIVQKNFSNHIIFRTVENEKINDNFKAKFIRTNSKLSYVSRDKNDSYAYKDVQQYIEENDLMPPEKIQIIKLWVQDVNNCFDDWEKRTIEVNTDD